MFQSLSGSFSQSKSAYKIAGKGISGPGGINHLYPADFLLKHLIPVFVQYYIYETAVLHGYSILTFADCVL
jgi:hypothetical protein